MYFFFAKFKLKKKKTKAKLMIYKKNTLVKGFYIYIIYIEIILITSFSYAKNRFSMSVRAVLGFLFFLFVSISICSIGLTSQAS